MPETGRPSPGSPEDYEGINFGVRECQICHDELETQRFGAHVLSHDPVDIQTKWAGGVKGLFGSLAESVETSIEAAEGHPGVQERLRLSLEGIRAIQRQL